MTHESDNLPAGSAGCQPALTMTQLEMPAGSRRSRQEGSRVSCRCWSSRFIELISKAQMLIVLAICTVALSSCNGTFFPTYTGSDADIRDKQLWTNMRDVQTAAEHYAANHGEDNYPKAIDNAFKSYLPGGGEDGENPRPVGLVNPYFGANEFPAMGSIKDIISVRNGPVPSLRPGEIQYSSIAGGKGYAIVGGGHDGKALRDYDGKVLVFTNFNDEELAEQAEKQ